MKLSEKINAKREQSPYMKIAVKHKVTYGYVLNIASGFRNPTKKKGLAVLKDLQELANQ